jgi:ribosome-associated toxin RatA of RatAB toxin-antitoxin module
MQKKKVFVCAMLCMGALCMDVQALDLARLLAEGPVLTIKQNQTGKFDFASVIMIVNAPIECVWNAIIDINRYCEFMPRVVQSKIIEKNGDGSEFKAQFEIHVPLMNQRYTLKYSLDPEKKIIDIVQIAGDLRGSHWHWKLTPHKKGTLVQYSGATKNYSAFLQKFEDDQQTMTVGVNVSSMMTVTRAIKNRAEKIVSEAKN